MRTEDVIREALQRRAAEHRVNPELPRSVAVRARAARLGSAMVAVAAAGALVLGGASVLGAVRDGDGGPRPVPAAVGEAGERQIEGAPYLLIGHDGWRVSRADQYSATIGEITFTNGERELELNWRPASDHEAFVEDRAREAADEWDVEIARRHGKLFRYEGTTDFTTLWMDGDQSLELRGVFPNVHAYRAVADTLDRVDEETWLAAMPDTTVVPSDRAAVVDAMVEDVPMHPDANIEQFRGADRVSDRYQLGARVTAAVACSWIRQWVEGRAMGDDRAVRDAVEAMESSRSWAILREMEPQGGWSEVVWEYADAMAGKGEVMGGRSLTVEESYRDALGCRR